VNFDGRARAAARFSKLRITHSTASSLPPCPTWARARSGRGNIALARAAVRRSTFRKKCFSRQRAGRRVSRPHIFLEDSPAATACSRLQIASLVSMPAKSNRLSKFQGLSSTHRQREGAFDPPLETPSGIRPRLSRSPILNLATWPRCPAHSAPAARPRHGRRRTRSRRPALHHSPPTPALRHRRVRAGTDRSFPVRRRSLPASAIFSREALQDFTSPGLTVYVSGRHSNGRSSASHRLRVP